MESIDRNPSGSGGGFRIASASPAPREPTTSNIHTKISSGMEFLRHAWSDAAIQWNPLASLRYAEAARNDGNPRLTYLTDYKVGLAGQPPPEEVIKVSGWVNVSVTHEVHRYALFPVVRSDGRMEPWMVVYSSKAPDGRFIDDADPKVIEVQGSKTRVYRSSLGANKSALMSLMSAAMSLREYIRESFAAHETMHLWVSHMHHDNYEEGFQYVTGASMGLAACAAILGCAPVMYTGFVREFNIWDRYKGEVASDTFPLTRSGEHLEIYPLLNPDDDVKDVREMPIKLLLGLLTGCPLVCPHSKMFSGSIQRLNAVIEIAAIMRDYRYNWANTRSTNHVGWDPALYDQIDGMIRDILSKRRLSLPLPLNEPNAWEDLKKQLYAVMQLEVSYPGSVDRIYNRLQAASLRLVFRSSQSCLFSRQQLAHRPPFYLATSASELPIISCFLSFRTEQTVQDKQAVEDVLQQIYRNKEEQYAPQSVMRSLRTKLNRKKATPAEKAGAKKLTSAIKQDRDQNKDALKQKKKDVRVRVTSDKHERKQKKDSKKASLASTRHRLRMESRQQAQRSMSNMTDDNDDVEEFVPSQLIERGPAEYQEDAPIPRPTSVSSTEPGGGAIGGSRSQSGSASAARNRVPVTRDLGFGGTTRQRSLADTLRQARRANDIESARSGSAPTFDDLF